MLNTNFIHFQYEVNTGLPYKVIVKITAKHIKQWKGFLNAKHHFHEDLALASVFGHS